MTWVTISDAAHLAAVGRRTISRWVKEGLITKNPDGAVDLEAIKEWRDFYGENPRRVHRDTQQQRYLR